MRVCIIPARGGSKRIPKKNIKDFCGLPMITYSIKAAFECGIFDRIIVSTDDEEIALIAKRYGAEIPFMRPDNLSGDHTATIPVIAHALQELEAKEQKIEHICCIYATAPFLQSRYLVEAYDKLIKDDLDFCFAATTFAYPVQRALYLQNERVKMLYPEYKDTRSQDLIETYHDAGQFYWGKKDAWLDQKEIFSQNSSFIEIPRYLVQDIDTPLDFKQAELMYKAQLL